MRVRGGEGGRREERRGKRRQEEAKRGKKREEENKTKLEREREKLKRKPSHQAKTTKRVESLIISPNTLSKPPLHLSPLL